MYLINFIHAHNDGTNNINIINRAEKREIKLFCSQKFENMG